MQDDDLLLFLQTAPLCEKLLSHEIKLLIRFCRLIKVDLGVDICIDKKHDTDLYLVKSGRLQVEQAVNDVSYSSSQLTRFSVFGEAPHLLQTSRKGSIVVKEKAELIAIDLDAMGATKKAKDLYGKILFYIAKNISSYLQDTNALLIESIQDRIKALNSYNQISMMIVQIFVLMGFWFNLSEIVDIVNAYTYLPFLTKILTPFMLMLFTGALFFLIRKSPYPLQFYGLTLRRFWKNAAEGVVYSIPMMALLLGIKWCVVRYISLFANASIFTSVHSLKMVVLWMLLYLTFTPLQEIIRGAIQSCFRNFFTGPKRIFLAILISNLGFQIMHTVNGIYIGLMSFFLGMYWGCIFEKQRSIVGAAVSHFLIGFWGYFILDFAYVLDTFELYYLQSRIQN